MILETSDNNVIINQEIAGGSRVLVADPRGKLKLARWRLMSDGYRVDYVINAAETEILADQRDTKALLISITGREDLETIKRIKSINKSLAIVAVLEKKAGYLKDMVINLGVAKTIGKPLDFPKLSAAVKAGLEKPEKRARNEQSVNRLNRAIREMRSTCRIFRQVLDNIETGILIVNKAGRADYLNQAMMSLLGLEGHIIGQDIKLALAHSTSPYHRQVQAAIQKVLQDSQKVINTGLVSSTPHELHEIEAYPVFSPAGEQTGVFVAVIGVGFRGFKSIMSQYEKLAAVGQLAAGAVHEIRNPLTSVKGFIQLLKNELDGTPKGEYINIILNEIDRINSITAEFLKLAKPSQPKKKAADLKDLFNDIRVLVDSEAFLKNIEIIDEIPESLPGILIDPEQIKQVIINVVRNSFEAMSNGGKLRVKCFDLASKRQVCLEISDTGEGMDEETVHRIFLPFFTTKDQGTGLGMALSKSIVERHGGHMEVRSVPNCGTTVCIDFPY